MGTRVESLTSFIIKVVSGAITRPANATAYTAGDVISDATADAHFTFSEVVQSGLHSGFIEAARCHSSANQGTKPDLELWLFNADIAAVADNAAFAPTDAEMLTLIGIIDFATANFKVGTATAGAGGNTVCTLKDVALPFRGGPDQKIYGQLVVRNAYTPVTGEILTVELVITQN